MDISIVLPKLNSKSLAQESLKRLNEYMAGLSLQYEIILVDDGSTEAERLKTTEVPQTVKVIQLERNAGKGAAVIKGMQEAKGDVCIFTDIDLPYDLKAIAYSYGLIKKNAWHCVMGERLHLNSTSQDNAPLARRLASRIFSKLATLFITGGIYDSQCGFKAFSHPLAKALFPLLTIERFSFDVEIYYIILKYRIAFTSIPVKMLKQETSTVSLFRHALPMVLQIMRIPCQWHQGKYASDTMRVLMQPAYWR